MFPSRAMSVPLTSSASPIELGRRSAPAVTEAAGATNLDRVRWATVGADAGSTVVLDAEMANVGVARRFVRNELQGQAPEHVASDLVLAVSELVTNAFEHGSRQPVIVTVRTDRDCASVTVISSGVEQPADVTQWRTAGADRISGRGLGIVRQLADDVDMIRHGETLEITVLRRFVPVDR